MDHQSLETRIVELESKSFYWDIASTIIAIIIGIGIFRSLPENLFWILLIGGGFCWGIYQIWDLDWVLSTIWVLFKAVIFFGLGIGFLIFVSLSTYYRNHPNEPFNFSLPKQNTY